MAKTKTVWGIDIGQAALKAIQLRGVDGQMRVEGLDVIEHPKLLSEPDANIKELVRNAMEKFISRNTLTGSTVCISVPGQSSFTRFVKLPPVETKKIPDIVRFEAEQQIPFPIADVIWRWQTFHDLDSPDVEVGIFAIKRSDINEALACFSDALVDVDVVQMAPLALYNFMTFDEQVAPTGATLLADIGVEKTDLVVSDGARIWTRTIQIGGSSFTEALVKAFKLSFSKAEKLKRTAASSKYARQLFQAMRPVFADLVQEFQRSIGYYTSLHRDARFKRLIGMGNGFRLPGLQKFLEQNLNIPVVRMDSYNKLQVSAEVNAAMFTENSLSLAVAYGVALQGLESATVSTNLLPRQIVRTRQWAKKRPWFAAAAGMLLLAVGMSLFRTYSDYSQLQAGQNEGLVQARNIVERVNSLTSEHGRWVSQGVQEQMKIEEILKLYSYRDYWPALQRLVFQGIQNQARHQRLLNEYADAQSEEQQKEVLARMKSINRSDRLMIFVDRMESIYISDITNPAAVGLRTSGSPTSPPRAASSEKHGNRGFLIRITGRTPLPKKLAHPFLLRVFDEWRALATREPLLSVVDHEVINYLDQAKPVRSASIGRGGRMGSGNFRGGARGSAEETEESKPAQAQFPDPLFPDDAKEDMANDTRFVIGLVVSIDEPSEGSSGG